LHAREAAPELIRFYRSFMEAAPDQVGGGMTLATAPSADFVPEEARGKPACGMLVVYFGDPDRGQQVLRPLLQWGHPLVSRVGPMPYTAVQAMTDDSHPWGIRHYARVFYLPDLSDGAVDAIVAQANTARSPFSQIQLSHVGGAVARMDRSAMALNMPEASWACFVFASWWDPRGHEEHIDWARGVVEAARPWAVDAAPANFIMGDETKRLYHSYGAEKYRRLVALKDAYDPENVFALNQNIKPSAVEPRALHPADPAGSQDPGSQSSTGRPAIGADTTGTEISNRAVSQVSSIREE